MRRSISNLSQLRKLASEIYRDSYQFSTAAERHQYRVHKIEEYAGPNRYALRAYIANIGKSKMAGAL